MVNKNKQFSSSRVRTCDLTVNSRTLYQLSYRGFWRLQTSTLPINNTAFPSTFTHPNSPPYLSPCFHSNIRCSKYLYHALLALQPIYHFTVISRLFRFSSQTPHTMRFFLPLPRRSFISYYDTFHSAMTIFEKYIRLLKLLICNISPLVAQIWVKNGFPIFVCDSHGHYALDMSLECHRCSRFQKVHPTLYFVKRYLHRTMRRHKLVCRSGKVDGASSCQI